MQCCMTTYISLLRGINVAGRRSIKMDALRAMYQALGLGRVRTYIQSGNVIFSAEQTKASHLEQIISSRLLADFGFDVPVLVLSRDRLAQIIASNPWSIDEGKAPERLFVTFLKDASATEQELARLEQRRRPGEELALTPGAIYLYCPEGYAQTKLSNDFIERCLGTQATTRNWTTITTLLSLAQD